MHLSLSRERAEGFRATLREHQLEPVAIVPSKHNWECAAGYVAMQELLALSSPPTAVFTANDRMAIGGMRATIEAGLRVPEDISFVGLDDIEISEFQNPPLSTIDQSFQELAALSVQLLLDLVAGEKPDLTQIVVEPQLIVRQSSVPAQVNVIA